MRKTPRWLCAVMALVMALAAPLLVAAQASAQQSAAMQPHAIYPDDRPSMEPTEGDVAGAALMNIVYVPGKAIVCSIGTVATVTLLLITFGSGYRAAKSVFNEGCGGSWVLTPEHLAGPPREDVR